MPKNMFVTIYETTVHKWEWMEITSLWSSRKTVTWVVVDAVK